MRGTRAQARAARVRAVACQCRSRGADSARWCQAAFSRSGRAVSRLGGDRALLQDFAGEHLAIREQPTVLDVPLLERRRRYQRGFEALVEGTNDFEPNRPKALDPGPTSGARSPEHGRDDRCESPRRRAKERPGGSGPLGRSAKHQVKPCTMARQLRTGTGELSNYLAGARTEPRSGSRGMGGSTPSALKRSGMRDPGRTTTPSFGSPSQHACATA